MQIKQKSNFYNLKLKIKKIKKCNITIEEFKDPYSVMRNWL